LLPGLLALLVAELGCSAGLVIANAGETRVKFYLEELCFWWHCSWISKLYY
jgi:hypothetical protein